MSQPRTLRNERKPPAGAAAGARTGGRPSRVGGSTFWARSWPYRYMLPAVVALCFAFLYPMVQVIRYSFYAGSPGSLSFIGLENYNLVLTDPVLAQSILDNVKLFAVVPVVTLIALFVAMIINSGVRGWREYRVIVFLPYILPATAIGLVFSYLLSQQGVINTGLHAIHAGAVALDWLGSPKLAIWSIGGVIVWQQLGFGVVVFTAALLSVPAETIEAARIDGASWWQIQWRVLLPQIRRIVEFFIILEVITILAAVFTFVYVLTKGGPGYSSSVLEYYIYTMGFSTGAIGAASASAVILLAIAAIFIVAYIRLRNREADR